MTEPRWKWAVGFVWVAGRGDGMEGMWVLNDLRYGCIDLGVCRCGRVIFRDSHFFRLLVDVFGILEGR